MADRVVKRAVISLCGKYRYSLSRSWGDGKDVAWIMLNPSTADACNDDPTIRKCIGFAKAWGFSGINVVNVAAYRATDPKNLRAAQKSGVNVVGVYNEQYATKVLGESDLVVVAWGAYDVSGFELANESFLRKFSNVKCLGKTKGGNPRHPLMLPYKTPLEEYFERKE